MYNNNFHLFIGALLQEGEERNVLRLAKRNLRDTHNAFEIPEAAFKQMFRLDKQSVLDLVNDIDPHYIVRGSIPLHSKVLATLNFLATGLFQNPVGCNIWLSLNQTMISRIIFEITALVSNFLFPIWIKFPINAAEKNDMKQGFYEKWNVRGVVGVIDGTQVEIITPPMNDVHHPPFVYINRKERQSINVMLFYEFWKECLLEEIIGRYSKIEKRCSLVDVVVELIDKVTCFTTTNASIDKIHSRQDMGKVH